MHAAAAALTALVAAEHVYILVLEMFLWQTRRGRRVFGMTEEHAALTAPLAKNQGLYNGFLAAGLLWGLVASSPAEAFHVKILFLSCVVVAGIYGGITAVRRILWLQALPAALALAAVLLAGAA